jgi:hypothetical protein
MTAAELQLHATPPKSQSRRALIYLMEASLLGMFMISACSFGMLFEHPGSPVRQAISDPLVRRMLMGVAMGLTAMALIYKRTSASRGR